IGKRDALPQFEGDFSTGVKNFPRDGEAGLKRLRFAIHSNKHSAGQVADCLGSFVRSLKRIERLGVGVQRKAEFPTRLGKRVAEYRPSQEEVKKQARPHTESSFRDRAI